MNKKLEEACKDWRDFKLDQQNKVVLELIRMVVDNARDQFDITIEVWKEEVIEDHKLVKVIHWVGFYRKGQHGPLYKEEVTDAQYNHIERICGKSFTVNLQDTLYAGGLSV